MYTQQQLRDPETIPTTIPTTIVQPTQWPVVNIWTEKKMYAASYAETKKKTFTLKNI